MHMQFNKTFLTVLCINALCVLMHVIDIISSGSARYVAVASVFVAFMVIPITILNLAAMVMEVVYGKKIYAAIIGLCFIISATCCFWLQGLSLKIHDRWFVSHGAEELSQCVNAIKENKEHLHSGYNERVNNFLQLPNIVRGDVMASTNTDGSLFVIFVNRDGFCDTGYVFYDGTNSVAGNSGRWTINENWGPYRLICKSWYEY